MIIDGVRVHHFVADVHVIMMGERISLFVNPLNSASASNGLSWLAADKVNTDEGHEQFIVLIEQLAV